LKTLAAGEAAAFLVGHLGLSRIEHRGAAGVRSVLGRLRCIQLDPLDPLGTNADLVALARVSGIARGDVYRHAFPGHAFEHFAKERCLLPASAFPRYRQGALHAPWWRHAERLRKVPASLVEEVLAEVRERGPIGAEALADRGKVAPLWSGWTSTGRATAMALDVLWTRCQIVVAGRGPRGKLYDVPERALPPEALRPVDGDFARWALLERVQAAGLLARSGGPVWSNLAPVRKTRLPDELVEEGLIEQARIEGSPRTYLLPAGALDRRRPRADGRVRILGPLDPLLWDRQLVRRAFGFEYVWEVYKPEAQRRWGWYVVPLLHGTKLVGRLDAAVSRGALRVRRLWLEAGADRDAVMEALERHAHACGVDRVAGRLSSRAAKGP